MCGITGFVDTSGQHTAAAMARVSRASDRLAARGPDGSGTWSDPFCAIGHRRLAIIDLSPLGAQPMKAFGRVITFNGEIFNFRELRKELEQGGRRFVSHSDTEVLLAGWDQWGSDLLDRLVGMFAFAIWDPKRRSLVVARDRFGEKPLFYWSEGSCLAFASDFLALEEVTGRRFDIDPNALRLFFALRYIPEPRTIARDAQKLAAGHVLHFSENGIEVKRWYRRPISCPPANGSAEENLAALRQAMDSAVSQRLVADVPVGAFLSSGIDSAIVAATMARHQPVVRTYTVGFDGASKYYEERPLAREIARYIGTEHTEIVVDPRNVLSILDDVFRSLDEPFGDSSAVASFIVAREARRHVKVALSGDGADEVFGGYRKYQGELYAGLYHCLPEAWRRLLIAPLVSRLPEGKHAKLLERFRRLKRFVAVADRERAARHAGWAEQLTDNELDHLFGARADASTLESIVAGIQRDNVSSDPVNTLLATDVELVLPGDMLVKVDRTSMANGLEVRCPFLDQRVVETAFSLPGSAKLRPGVTKWALRKAFSDRLPQSVFRRPKKGFEIPIAEWLIGPLRDRVRAAIDPERLRRQGLFAPDLPQQWLDQLISRRRDTSWALWTLLAFQSWATLNGRAQALT